MLTHEFIYRNAPVPNVHASTIAETPAGLVAAWFGGSLEGEPDVEIWLARHIDGHWTDPVRVADGVQPDGSRWACWNPVLFRHPDGTLRLFYKVGTNTWVWWGMTRTSTDDGRTWGEPVRLSDGFLGPVKNKPVRLADGTVLCPTSTEALEPPHAWDVRFELTDDRCRTWTASEPPRGLSADHIDAIQPSVLLHPDGSLQAIGRTGCDAHRIFSTYSLDNGRTWSPLTLTPLPNPNSGTDAVTLRDGRHLLVYNHTDSARVPLNVAVSADGIAWQAAAVLEDEPGEYSYPAVIQSADGLVHITYTWHRARIKHVVLDPVKLPGVPMPNGAWPAKLSR